MYCNTQSQVNEAYIYHFSSANYDSLGNKNIQTTPQPTLNYVITRDACKKKPFD